ncbi:hypothetical protein B0A50_04148 [Salinomyces thailandicus]|uniref:RING-type domain-containing protein n=1 Tax=Salinomyces thailandicus TaxID=706561 RepID=A0A4U0U090_9PEZI|nr:hypothetical protein B0A50_04148 [Salinomyces thailandica]
MSRRNAGNTLVMNHLPGEGTTLPTPVTYDIDALTSSLKANPSAGPPQATNHAELFGYYLAESTLRVERTHNIRCLNPHVAGVTIVLIGALFMKWSLKTWPFRLADLFMTAVCLVLLWPQQIYLTLLASNIAIFYAVWTFLPGSCIAEADVPSLAQFMDSVKTTPQPDGDEDRKNCIICWDDSNELAVLPCKHEACKDCLQAIGNANQTSCPLCRCPLFTTKSPRYSILLAKSLVGLYAASTLLHLLIAFHRYRRREYWHATWPLLLLAASTLNPLYLTMRRIKNNGKDWWTQDAGTFFVKMNLASTFFTILSKCLEIGYLH